MEGEKYGRDMESFHKVAEATSFFHLKNPE